MVILWTREKKYKMSVEMMQNEKKERMGKRKKLMITKEIWMQKDNLIEDPLPHKTYTSHINQKSFGFMNKIEMHRERERMIEYFKQSLHLGPNMSKQNFFAIFPLMMDSIFWSIYFITILKLQ